MKLSFIENSLDGIFYGLMYDKYVRFDPFSFTKGYKGMKWDAKKHTLLIKKAQIGEEISFFDRKRNFFSSSKTGTNHPHQSISIAQSSEIFLPTNEEMNEIVTYSSGFIAGYLYNEEYMYVQSTSSETNFLDRNICQGILDTLKKTPFKLGVFGDKEYDVKFNPGRQILIGRTWLMAAWKMWFGQPFFEIVPKEKILNFPHALEIKELPGGQVFVHLFDKVDESYTPDSMFRQWKWNEWLDFDELEKKYP